MEIKHITEEEARQITKTGEPIGLFYKTGLTVYGETMYIGIDNLTGQAGIRAFKTETDCVEWLRTLDRKGANMEIKKISQEMAQKIIDTGEPRGLFYEIDGNVYVGIDNMDGHAWVEEFKTKEKCFSWLRGDRDLEDTEGTSEDKEEYLTELQRKQLKIFEHYGHEKQLDMLVEECSELIQAIMKAKRANYAIFNNDVLQELANVKNLLQQLELKYEYLKKAIDFIVECKVDRQLERIEKGE